MGKTPVIIKIAAQFALPDVLQEIKLALPAAAIPGVVPGVARKVDDADQVEIRLVGIVNVQIAQGLNQPQGNDDGTVLKLLGDVLEGDVSRARIRNPAERDSSGVKAVILRVKPRCVA